MAYMVDRDGVALGPYSREELREKVRSNELLPTDRACHQSGGIWLPVSKVLARHSDDTAEAPPGKVDGSTIFASIRRAILRR
jgi:hypothetical protein